MISVTTPYCVTQMDNTGNVIIEGKSRKRIAGLLQALRPGRLSGMPNGIRKGLCRKKLNPKVKGTKRFARIEKARPQ